MAFLRRAAVRPELPMRRASEAKKGIGKTVYEPKSWEASPPIPLPVSDPVTGWTRTSKRVGAIGFKLGMSSDFDSNYELAPLTFIQIPECRVSQVKTTEKEGYDAIQLAAGPTRKRQITKPLMQHLEKAGVGPRKELMEFPVTADALLPVGTKISAKHFLPGQYIDVQAMTKGRGFAGAMKRWGFKGLPATHGVSLTHRSLGATGARQDPGKVWKGKKMPGHMGQDLRYQRNLVVMRVDTRFDVIAVRGSIPGGKGTWVRIEDAAFKPFTTPPPFPTYFPKFNEPKESLIAKLPTPPSWGETDLTITDTTPEDPWPETDNVEEELSAEQQEAIRVESKLKSRKGMRIKAKKLEKKLKAAGGDAPPGKK